MRGVFWVGDERVVRDMTPSEEAALRPAPTAEELLARLAERRYRAEESGTVFNGYTLATDRVTQAKLTAVYIRASSDPKYTIKAWKFAPGVFAPLDAATIIAAVKAVEAHVQACFQNEARITAQIMAAKTPQQLAAVDIEGGWP